MSADAWSANRRVHLQLAAGLLGMLAFCIYSRTWRDWPHVVYDIPASFAVFCFIGQLLLEAVHGAVGRHWTARFILLAAMTVVCVGRELLDWPISGHLSCVLAVAIVQSADRRLPLLERLAYWLPLPVVLTIRWYWFDLGQHGQTYNAIAFALIGSLAVVWVSRRPAAVPDTSGSR